MSKPKTTTITPKAPAAAPSMIMADDAPPIEPGAHEEAPAAEMGKAFSAISGTEAAPDEQPATPTQPEPATAVRGPCPESDRVGMLAHLVEHHGHPDHPASFTVDYASETGPDILITFTCEREVDGKWKKIKRTAVGMNIDDAAGNMARELAS